MLNLCNRAAFVQTSIAHWKNYLGIPYFISIGNFKDVAALIPGSNFVSEDLLRFTKNIIALVHSCGFKVVVKIADNKSTSVSYTHLTLPTIYSV